MEVTALATQHNICATEALEKFNAMQLKKMRDEVAAHIQVCRIRRLHRGNDAPFCQIQFASRSADPRVQNFLRLIVEELGANADGEMKYGMAPPGRNEREIRSLLRLMGGEEDE